MHNSTCFCTMLHAWTFAFWRVCMLKMFCGSVAYYSNIIDSILHNIILIYVAGCLSVGPCAQATVTSIEVCRHCLQNDKKVCSQLTSSRALWSDLDDQSWVTLWSTYWRVMNICLCRPGSVTHCYQGLSPDFTADTGTLALCKMSLKTNFILCWFFESLSYVWSFWTDGVLVKECLRACLKIWWCYNDNDCISCEIVIVIWQCGKFIKHLLRNRLITGAPDHNRFNYWQIKYRLQAPAKQWKGQMEEFKFLRKAIPAGVPKSYGYCGILALLLRWGVIIKNNKPP